MRKRLNSNSFQVGRAAGELRRATDAPALRRQLAEEIARAPSCAHNLVAGFGSLTPTASAGRRPWVVGLVALWLGFGILAGQPSEARPHWSFRPLASPELPQPRAQLKPWPRNGVDHFILERLEHEGLNPANEAAPLVLLRRACLDLTGLPPTPSQVAAFLQDRRPEAWARTVDDLLRSPRYGERWAQHWLDVVRYADTDGFEVNTERRNAWPYRDYVIRAFNRDVPYDRFIRDQLIGDALGEDAAMGFLVTAAALLPGQIGADDVSKRLARQDALSEIVTGVGESLLGLSIGCARCHDHKFDPILQRDFYALQAFFAGVHYGERPIKTPEAEARQREALLLKPRLLELQQALVQFEPLAQTDAPARKTSARFNEEIFAPREVRFVRFTIHDANLHPTLGLIEPCLDEFEIFTAEDQLRNVALATQGAKVTVSGSRTSEAHRLEHINDGRYGNSRSWMADEAGRGWVLVELPAPVRVGRVAWSRDREGTFSDRLPTAFTLEVGMTLDAMQRVRFFPPRRRPVSPRMTIDRFTPVSARRLRFSITACTTLEPCLDELEVFTAGKEPRNVALASHGTKASSSSTLPESTLHRLEHVNDGKFGNARSWISGETGRGWIELEFPGLESIDRVVWGRDREEKFKDRLPTEYRVEVVADSGAWQVVAGSADRVKYDANEVRPVSFSSAGLGEEETRQAQRLLDEKKSLEAKIATLEAVPMAFAGNFSTPEATHLLHRGDPEQPRERVAPAVLSVFSTRGLPAEAADRDRRFLLAEWIGSSENPLTARVMVNRIWQGHFGMGLVETASDFGLNGGRPSHPALLDWLASEFIRSGWSIKNLHRLIMNSATYRQSSRIDPNAQARDGECRWLWRFPARRLEAELIRDSMLAVSGRLNLQMGGPGFNLFRSRGGLDGFPPIESFNPDGLRRMIYAHKVRMERDPVFSAFDCPDAGQGTPRRGQSTTPIQALNLFNSRFTLEIAEAFAARVVADAGSAAALTVQIQRAYQLALGRVPRPDEMAAIEPVVRDHGLSSLGRVLFNSNEFLFLP